MSSAGFKGLIGQGPSAHCNGRSDPRLGGSTTDSVTADQNARLFTVPGVGRKARGAQLGLEDLGGRSLRQLRQHAHVARDHEVGEPVAQELDQGRRVDRAPRRRCDDREDLVLAELARHRDDGRLADVGEGDDLGLDLERRNVLAAAPDRVLDAVDEEVIAVGVDPEGIAGVEPAIAPGPRRRFQVLVVAVVHRPGPVGTHQHLADLADGDLAVVRVDQPHVDARAHLAAGAAHRRIRLRDDGRGDLGHVEDRVDVRAEAPVEFERALAERHDEALADTVVAVVRAGRCLEQERRHDAEQEDGRHLRLPDQWPEAVGREALRQHDRTSAGQHRETQPETADVEERHVDEEAVLAGDEVPGLGPRVRIHVQVRRQHALGRPRGSGRVDDRLRIPRLDRAGERARLGGALA